MLITKFSLTFSQAITIIIFYSGIIITKSKLLRVIGGRDVLPNEFPYVVRIERVVYNDDDALLFPQCTAAVLTSTWTLTAAHCVPSSFISREINPGNIDLSLLVIRYASSASIGELRHDDKYSKVIRAAQLPIRRSEVISWDDIILLQTDPIQLETYGKVSAVDFPALYGQEAVTVGHGCTDPTQPYNTTWGSGLPLQVAKSMLKRCPNMIMSGYPDMCLVRACSAPVASRICQGDSGGPVIHPTGIVGVNSKIPESSFAKVSVHTMNHEVMGMVTPVSLYIDWIYDSISKIET